MADPIRVGIVGATVTPGGSGWGASAHVPALAVLPDYILKAVCTAHEDTAKASAEKFGAELAFHDFEAMCAHPEIDLVVVCVRAPLHHGLVMAGLRAGKAVFCEWPLGANLAEAEEMAGLAQERGLRTLVGLQGRSDPTVRYAHDLVAGGYVGEVLAVNLNVSTGAVWERGAGRIWQRERANGANTLTIAGGHGIDAMCAVVGEFAELSARAVPRVTEWLDTDTNKRVPVDSPDAIGVAGRLESGAEVTVQVAAVPNPTGSRLEIYGREGTVVLSSRGALSAGPNVLISMRGRETEELSVPGEYTLVPEGTPPGPPRNVAQAYASFADALQGAVSTAPDFAVALTRHRLIDAIERSAGEGRPISL